MPPRRRNHVRRPGRKQPRSQAARRRATRRVLGPVLGALGIAVGALTLALAYFAWSALHEFEQRRWDRPARVYAAPLDLYPSRPLRVAELRAELGRLGYRHAESLAQPGSMQTSANRIDVHVRAYAAPDGRQEPARRLSVRFSGDAIAALEDAQGRPADLARLEPLLIGSLFPAHGEDRLVLGPEEISPLLTQALQAVEDRRFLQHRGIDLKAVARAAWVNLRHGEIRQGASTLTQQLVRSYFLDNDRSWWRKLREAAMAIVLELRYDKSALMQAYVNEVYLGQDGARAVHGFGLASQFYFGKPARELTLEEIATLVGLVRGPAYYDPRLHPERARDRRNLVLKQMEEFGAISAEQWQTARVEPLHVLAGADEQTGHYGEFLDLVRRQLATDYPEDVLTRAGLGIFTTLSPIAQAAAEQTVAAGTRALAGERAAVELEAAALVAEPHSGDVLAVVGSRAPGFDGLNRALNARRPIGSLVKPAVYLAALQTGRYSLASLIEDREIGIDLPNGARWSPTNFDGIVHGPVPLVRALADSLNLATVRLGLDVGADAVARLLADLGLEHAPPAYPSLLLGALELTPLEVTQIYSTLANGGFRVPLRAVSAVIDANGAIERRYALRLEPAADTAAVHQINHALVYALQRGTGRWANQRLPEHLILAGKTGTSDGLRDSWFAGYGNDRLAVVWIGNDQNQPTGLTGATGAAMIWADLMTALHPAPFAPPPLPALSPTWIDYETGTLSGPRCEHAVELPLPQAAQPPHSTGCAERPLGQRLREWWQGRGP